ncbi:MAG: hypothetical protein GC145_01775 [Caulobacter sp.]|nr:hypothetical protein [Caulobacter sp.]
MSKTILAAVLGSAVMLSGAAAIVRPQVAAAEAPAAKKKSDCFFNSQVNNFTAPDDEILYVKAGRTTYRMEMFGRCLDLDNALNIALESRPGSSICGAQDVTVIVQSNGMGTQRCMVKTLTALTPAEVAALPKGHKP